MSNPTYTATYCTDINNITVNDTHGAACSMAMVDCVNFTGDLGDEITISIGYDDNNVQKFVGYVKEFRRSVTDMNYVVTALDKMTRAVDYTLVASDPEHPFTRSNILAETLVSDLMAEAGLTSFTTNGATTYLHFATKTPVEIDLTSSYDYCKSIAELMAWSIWCDQSGTVHFENRKPYPMDGSTGEIGDNGDPTDPFVLGDTSKILSFTWAKDEKNLRNRVVIRGQGVTGEASEESPYLPEGFYKTACWGAPQLIDDQTLAQQTAEINLNAFNHLTEIIECTILGDPAVNARTVIQVNEVIPGISGLFYVHSCVNTIGKQGYITSLSLRRRA